MPLINNPTRLAVAVILLSLLSACSNTQVRRAESILVELPQVQQREYSPEIRQRYQQAIALLRQDQTASAQQALQALLADDAEIPGAWYNLALIQHQQNDTQSALQSLERCLSLSPRNAYAHTLNGIILRQQGQFSQAQVAYAKALESDSDYADAHLNLAILYDIYLQYFTDAEIHYQRYLELAVDGETSEQAKLWLQDLQLRIQLEGK